MRFEEKVTGLATPRSSRSSDRVVIQNNGIAAYKAATFIRVIPHTCNFSPIKIPIVRSFKFNKEKIDIKHISESFMYDKGKIYSKDSHPPSILRA